MAKYGSLIRHCHNPLITGWVTFPLPTLGHDISPTRGQRFRLLLTFRLPQPPPIRTLALVQLMQVIFWSITLADLSYATGSLFSTLVTLEKLKSDVEKFYFRHDMEKNRNKILFTVSAFADTLKTASYGSESDQMHIR